jgi:hypothetical protein
LSQLPLKVQATRKLHGIASSQWVPKEERSRIRSHLSNQLHNREHR